MRDLDQLSRIMKALVVAAVSGAAILVLVQYLILRKVKRGLTTAQRLWLRDAFNSHTAWFLFAIVALAAIISLRVLLVALRVLRRRA